MPNLKIFVDESISADAKARLHDALPSLRDMMCELLDVPLSAAQFMLVPVLGLADQALLAVEMQILPKPSRTRENLLATSERLRERLRAIADVKIAVRITTVDPDTYIVVR